MASTNVNREVFEVKPTVAVLYSDAAGAALVHALKAWRETYSPGHGYEGLVGGPIKVVQSKIRLLPGPRAIVVISIEGRRYGTDDAYYYDVTMNAGELILMAHTDDEPLDVTGKPEV